MTTIYYIEHNGNRIDQDVSIESLLLRLQTLAKANPNNHYIIVIEGPGNPIPPETI